MSSATELRRALSAASIDAQVADDIIAKAVKAGEVVDDVVTPEQIDAAMEAIKKSLGEITEEEEVVAKSTETVEKAYAEEDAEEMDEDMDEDDDEDEDDEDEDEDEDMGKAWPLVDVIAKSADAIVREVAQDHRAMAKAYGTMANSVTTLAKAMKDQAAVISSLRSQLDDVSKALGQPVARRSVAELDVIEQPAEAAVAVEGDLVQKALGELKLPETTDVRRRQLYDAIAAMESGINPAAIAQRYSL